MIPPPLTGDPVRDAWNMGFYVGMMVGAGSMMLLCLFLAIMGVFSR